MPKLKIADIESCDEVDLAQMSREELEAWARQVWELARRLANQLGQNSTNSSRPPSSDDPYRRGTQVGSGGGQDGEQEQPADQAKKAGSGASASSAQASSAKDKARKRPGKQPGARGCWRTQPLVITAPDAEHYPPACDCGAASCIEQKTRQVSAHLVCDLERGDGQLRIPVSRAGEGQRWLLTPIQARELRLLARDRNFLVQTLLMPALILGAQFFFNTNGTALLGSLLHHPEQVAAAAFAVSAYALMFSAFQTLNAEGQALWILYSVPQSLASVLRQKGYFWAVASLVYPVIIFGLAMTLGGMAFSQSSGLVIVVFLGAPIYATIAVSLGVFACDPLARTVDRRVSQSYVYLYMSLSSIYVLAIYASTIWQRGVSMFLTTLFAFALWQRARDHLPYLLDPDASPPSRVSVSDGIMAALLLFVLQAIAMLILRFNGVPQTGDTVMLTVAAAGAIAFGVIRLAFWLLKSQDMPKTFGPGGSRAAVLGLAGGVAAALAAFVYLKLAVQAGFFERSALLPANKSMLLIGALVVLAVPIFEEFIFRGLLFRGFRRSLGLTASIISSATLFAIVHPPASVIPVFGLGIVTALVYERTQLLIGTMVAHAVYNALIISLPLIFTL